MNSAAIVWILVSAAAAYVVATIAASQKGRGRIVALESAANEREKRLRGELKEAQAAVNAGKMESTTLSIQLTHVANLLHQKAQYLPWLTEAIANAKLLSDLEIAKVLETKKHPARKAAEELRKIATEKNSAIKELMALRYQIAMIADLAPTLVDDTDVTSLPDDEALVPQDHDEDRAKLFLTEEEFSRLSPSEKYQRALENYNQQNKSNWQIGREYERYVGYIYEHKGCDVEYVGAKYRLSDLGRDLVIKKDGVYLIVQCKNWAARKTIFEKHIYQLVGTAIDFYFDKVPAPLINGFEDMRKIVTPVFVTATALSPRAKKIAETLGVQVIENLKLGAWPQIKCNINDKGDRIYHLPFDLSYDRVKIIPARGEQFVSQVSEAEELGFRRAFKWRGSKTTR